MRISFETTGDFEETIKWLQSASQKVPTKTIDEISREGVQALAAATPVGDTGETARGWFAKTETAGNVTEIWFGNNAHPEASVSVATVIDTGHGTGTGGYVQPRPYIKKALSPIFDNAGDKLIKEMME